MNPAMRAAENLEKIRQATPLVHNITNFVVMNFTANVLLAMGASPVMAHCREEAQDMARLAGAVVLNIGTLTPEWVESMVLAGQAAVEKGTPVVLDPVGSGATAFRTQSAKKILSAVPVPVVRGNASEVLSLRESGTGARGVDSVHSVDQAAGAAEALALELNTVLAITGPTDFITNGQVNIRVCNGHPLMGRITGSGCAATAVIGAFLAVEKDPLQAVAGSLAFFGLAGEIAAKNVSGPGSFVPALLDALDAVTPDVLKDRAKIEVNG